MRVPRSCSARGLGHSGEREQSVLFVGIRVAMSPHIMTNGNSPQSHAAASPLSAHADLICLSHLRWNFVFQRPQHLMSRYAIARRVYFVEEPIFHEHLTTATASMEPHGRLLVVT